MNPNQKMTQEGHLGRSHILVPIGEYLPQCRSVFAITPTCSESARTRLEASKCPHAPYCNSHPGLLNHKPQSLAQSVVRKTTVLLVGPHRPGRPLLLGLERTSLDHFEKVTVSVAVASPYGGPVPASARVPGEAPCGDDRPLCRIPNMEHRSTNLVRLRVPSHR